MTTDAPPGQGRTFIPNAGPEPHDPNGIPAGPPDTEGKGRDAAWLRFDAEKGVLFGKLLKYGLLTILTLGIYRFWAKTHVRRYLWNSVSLAGDSFTYHGTPKELFIGFLIVVVILSPLLALFGFSEFAYLYYGATTGVLMQAVYFVALFLLWSVAVYRMSRYRLTRTSWRGIRFGLDGSAWTYLGKAVLWNLATLFSLGLAFPWMRHTLNKYRLDNVRFGSLHTSYGGKPGELAYLAIGPAFLVYAPLIAVVLLAGPEILSGLQSFGELNDDGRITYVSLKGLAVVLIPFVYITTLAGFIWFRVREYRYMLSNTRLGGSALQAELSTGRVFKHAVIAGIATVFAMFVVFGVVFGIGIGAIALVQGGEFGAIIAGFLTFALVFFGLIFSGAIWTVLFTLNVIRDICEGLTVENATALENAVQAMSGDAALTGEGLADALDVGAL